MGRKVLRQLRLFFEERRNTFHVQRRRRLKVPAFQTAAVLRPQAAECLRKRDGIFAAGHGQLPFQALKSLGDHTI
jgi:hypothetical protein